MRRNGAPRWPGSQALTGPATRPECAHQHHQTGGTRTVRQRGQQRPAEHHIRQAAGGLPDDQTGQRQAVAAQRGAGLLAQPPGQPGQRGQRGQRHDPVRHVDGHQRIQRQVAAVPCPAQRALQREAGTGVHRRPPLAVAGGKSGAGQHRVIAADPATQRDLQQQQRAHQRHRAGRSPARTAPGRPARLDRRPMPDQRPVAERRPLQHQQRKQHQRAQQMQGDDRRVELERDGVFAKQPLHDHPGQRGRRPGR